MLYINLKRVMRLRNVENHYKMLLDLGFAPATARNFLGNTVRRIDFDILEKLCLAFNCIPNDLLQWHPTDDNKANADETALIKLKRSPDDDLPRLLSSLPMEKFEEVRNLLQDLKNK